MEHSALESFEFADPGPNDLRNLATGRLAVESFGDLMVAIRRASKLWQCEHCGDAIWKGQSYLEGKNRLPNGFWQTIRFCSGCTLAHPTRGPIWANEVRFCDTEGIPRKVWEERNEQMVEYQDACEQERIREAHKARQHKARKASAR